MCICPSQDTSLSLLEPDTRTTGDTVKMQQNILSKTLERRIFREEILLKCQTLFAFLELGRGEWSVSYSSSKSQKKEVDHKH